MALPEYGQMNISLTAAEQAAAALQNYVSTARGWLDQANAAEDGSADQDARLRTFVSQCGAGFQQALRCSGSLFQCTIGGDFAQQD